MAGYSIPWWDSVSGVEGVGGAETVAACAAAI